MGHKSLEQERADFLAKHPSWVQKMLQLDYKLSSEETKAWVESDPLCEKFHRIREEYERIIRQNPAWYRTYRKKSLKNQVVQWIVPPPLPLGRPRKDDLAREAIELKNQRKSYVQVARELNRRYETDNNTPESVRKLIGSRKPRQRAPDKT